MARDPRLGRPERSPPPLFELSQLRCFVAVAEELHFGRAAARLNMTQPPLSRQIQVLERILDVVLLERTSRSVRLTPTGRSFLPEAQRLIRAAEVATEIAKRVHSGKSGSLKIAFTAVSAYSFLPSLLTACLREMPDIELSLSEMVTRDQIEGLLSGQVDIGLLRPPITRPELEAARVLAEPLLLAVPNNHRLANAKAAALKDCDGEPFIMYSPQEARYFHDLLVSLFANAQVLPRYVQHLTQIHSILALVRAGLGITIVPASAANLHYEGVTILPLQLRKAAPAELYAVWRRDQHNPLLDRMLEVIRNL
jgi:DNA-binding transcriptional LysR family regulator